MADIESNIRFGVDTSDAIASIKALQAQISAFQKQMASSSAANADSARRLRRSLIDDINATGQFSASIKTIKSSSESFTNALEKNKLSMGEYFRFGASQVSGFRNIFTKEFNTIEKTARERVKDLQTQYISLGRDANGALKAIAVRPLKLDMESLATQTAMNAQRQQIFNQLLKQGSTNLLNFGKNTQWAGRQLMVGFTIPLSIFGTRAAQTFMKLEEQAIRFKRVYGELFTGEAETNAMAKQIQELALQFTKYGVAVESTMSLAADAAAMGKQGADLTAQVSEATRLAVLGNVEQSQALETTISLTNAFGTAADELAQKIDFLNAVENQTVTSIQDLTIAIPKAGPVIQQLGGDVEDLAFFLTAMKEGGINASEGANALKSGLASLINPTDKASEMLLGFGINIQKIVDANKGDVRGIVVEFAQALDDLDPTTRARAIEQLFGKFQFARLSTLFQNVIQGGTQAQRVLDLAAATTGDLAALSQKELGRLEESTSYKFQKAVADLQAAIAPVGEDFLKAITPVVEFATKILNAFNNMDAGVRQFVVTAAAVLGGLGPVLIMTFGLLSNGVANALKGFAFLRERFLGLGTQSNMLGDQIDYMTQEQLQAAAVAASLDQVHSTLIQRFTAEAGTLDALTAAYRRNSSAMAALNVAPIPTNIGKPRKMQDGGVVMVPGSGKGDKVPAMLEPGEAIIPSKMVKKYGGLINGMIADSIPGYQNGKKGSGASMYGGQTILLSGLGILAPGNTPGSKFGMNKDFFASGEGFGTSLMASAVGGAAVLDNPNVRMTKALVEEYSSALKDDIPRIVDALRLTSKEMELAGKSTDSLEDIVKEAKSKLQVIFDDMTARGGKAKSAATAMKEHLFFPTPETMGGRLGETRAPGVRESVSTGQLRGTMYRVGGSSPFQSRVSSAYRNLTGSAIPGSFTYAHANEARMLGPTVPMAGRAMGLPAPQRAAFEAEIAKRNEQLRSQYSPSEITTRKNRESGRKAAQAAVDGINEGFQNASPSKKMYVAGKDGARGAINAITDAQDDMAKAGERLGQAATSGMTQARASRRATSGGTIKFDEKSQQYMTATRFEKQQAARQEATSRVTNMAIASMTNFTNKIQGASFAIAGIAGVMTMFGGTIGEIGGILFQLSGAIGSLILVTQLLITAKMKEAAASAIADLGGPKGMLGGAGLLKNIGTVLSAAVPNLMRFVPVIGAVVAGLGVLGFVIDQINKQKEKIEGLGSAAFASAEKIKALGNAFGFTPKTSALPTAFQGKAAVSPEAAAQASAMAASEEFKTQWSKEIEAIKGASADQANAILYSLAQQLSVSGAPAEVVQAILRAITEAAGKTDLNLSFAKIDFSSGNAKMAVADAVNLFKKDADAVAKQQTVNLTGGVQVARNPQLVSQVNKENAAIAAGAFASDITALNMQLTEGTISADQFNAKMGELSVNFASLGEQGQKLVLPDLISRFGPDAVKTVEGIKNMEDSFKLLQAAASGLDPTTVQNIATAIKEGQNSQDPAKTAKYKSAQDQLNKVLKTQANVTAENVKKAKEKLKQDQLQTEFTASTDAIQADIDAILEQNAAYEDLIAKGWSAADALAAVRNENFMNAYAAAANATAQQQVIDKFKELLNITKTSPVTGGGGGGTKSPYQQATEQLKEQRQEIINSNVAYNKLTKAGFGIADAMKAAEDPILAAAIATTKVDSKNWDKLINRIKNVQALLSKKEIKDLLKGGKTEIADKRAQVAVSSALSTLGWTAENIDTVLSDQTFTNTLAKDLEDGVINSRDLLNRLSQIKQLENLNVELNFTTKEGAAEEFQKIYDKAVGYLEAQKQVIEIDFQVNTQADNILIREAEAVIAAIQFKIDDYEAELAGIQEKEDAINEKYDARNKALDKIAKANDAIARQQRSQLTLADALSQGDIAAAARAVQEIREQQTQDQLTKQGDLLELSKEKELASIRSVNNRSRKQIEDEIKKLKKDIFNIEEQTLEPARERIRLATLEKDRQLDSLNSQILAWEQLSAKVNEAKLKLTPEEMEAMKFQAGLIADMLKNWENIKDKKATLTIMKKTVEESTGGSKDADVKKETDSDKVVVDDKGKLTETEKLKEFYGGNIAGLINNLDAKAKQAQIAADRASSSTAFKASGLTTAGFINKLDSVAAKNAVVAKKVAESTKEYKASGLSLSAYMKKDSQPGKKYNPVTSTWYSGGGFAKGYRMGGLLPYKAEGGSIFKPLGTDTIPAMLTPGEFVVRKYAVDNFGVDRLKAINSGTYNGDSVYNYGINVNVQTDANPDQIARAVIGQIKQIESQRIRGNRF